MFLQGYCRPRRLIPEHHQMGIAMYIMRKQGYTGLIVSPNHIAGRFLGDNITKMVRRDAHVRSGAL